jgi:hypothetical protein
MFPTVDLTRKPQLLLCISQGNVPGVGPVEVTYKHCSSLSGCYPIRQLRHFFQLQALIICNFEKFDFTLLQSADLYPFISVPLGLM